MPNNELPLRFYMLRSSRLFTDRMNQILSKFELNYSLWMVLYTIESAQQSSLVDISYELNISQPAVSKRIFELEQKQLIDYVPTDNRREKIVCLTPKGLVAYRDCKVLIQQLEEKYCTGISPNDVVHLKHMLNLFLTNMMKESGSNE